MNKKEAIERVKHKMKSYCSKCTKSSDYCFIRNVYDIPICWVKWITDLSIEELNGNV